jgi:hypothetical protein
MTWKLDEALLNEMALTANRRSQFALWRKALTNQSDQ